MTRSPSPDAERPWWRSFFDETYATVGLTGVHARPPEELIAFLVERLGLAERSSLFDQCCGIGRLSLPLARRGVRVIGVDQAQGYVERARIAAEAESLPCAFHCADAHAFTAPEPCDAAVNWFTSFGYSDDDELNAQMLHRAFESLKPGGRFLLEYQNVPRVLGEFLPCHIHRQPLDDGSELIVLQEGEPDFARGMVDMRWTFIHPDGRRESRQVMTRLIMPHEVVAMMRRCGFDQIDLLGSVAGEPFDRRSRRLIAFGMRPL